jgi:hypothetical protein
VLPFSNGSPWLYVSFQKSNLTFGGVAVAFLMFMNKKKFYMCQAIRKLIGDGRCGKKADFSVAEFEKRMLTSN